MPSTKWKLLACHAVLLLISTSTSRAIDLTGTARIFATNTDSQTIDSQNLEQLYNLNLFQRYGPYLSFRLGYSHFSLDTQFGESIDLNRRSRRPRFDLAYSRRRFSALLSVESQYLDQSTTANSFDQRSLIGNVAWQSKWGLNLSLNFRDQLRTTDPDVFGRDAEARFATFQASYSARGYNVSYSYRKSSSSSEQNELSSDQDRHELRGSASRGFWDQRLRFTVRGDLSRLQRDTSIGDTTEIAEPIPSLQGLFAIDTSPFTGSLETAPGLIDGNFEAAAVPDGDIGGANTFRNVGLDLGVTRPVTRLQIFLDNVSGPGLVWQVYRSRDNFVWELVPGVTSEFDSDLLRYSIRIPETSDRYFKAVNVSVNPVPEVRITEMRALIDAATQPGVSSFESTLYTIGASALFQPIRRLTGQVNVSLTNDEDISAGFVRRDFSATSAGATLTYDILSNLRITTGYRLDDREEFRDPVLLRTVSTLFSRLEWVPLSTVDVALDATRRDESEEDQLLEQTDTLRLIASTELLPTLRLDSQLSTSIIDDPFSGTSRDLWIWSEALMAELTLRWRVTASFDYTLYSKQADQEQRSQIQYHLFTTWTPTSFLSLSGRWSLSDQDISDSFTQNYSLSYSPGRKFSLTAAYQEYSTEGLISQRGTSTTNLGASYRLNQYLQFFGNVSSSEAGLVGTETDRTENVRFGMQFNF